MNLLKFFFGIILAQAATYLLIYMTPDTADMTGFMRFAVPLLFIALILAFWFTSIAGHTRKDAVSKIKDDFATERDKLRTRTQKELAKASARAHAKANFKVGVAFAGMLGVGVLFLFAQMMTAGLLAISASVGAMGGYYWRGKRVEKQQLKELETNESFQVIDSKPLEGKQPKE
jgi:hypothetical protein